MRSTILTGILIACLALVPLESRTQTAPDPPVNPNAAGLYCACVVVMIAVGAIVIKAIVRLCHNIESNRNYWLTNGNVDSWRSVTTEVPGSFTLQRSLGIGQGWLDGYSVNVWQTGNTVYAVLSTNGQNIATNSAAIESNGANVVIDFRPWTPREEAPRAIGLYRAVPLP